MKHVIEIIVKVAFVASTAALLVDAGRMWRHGSLHRYGAAGDIDKVHMLIKEGEDLEEEIEDHTPLSLAAANGHLDLVKLLVESGANVKHRCYHAALTEAVFYQHPDVVSYLLEHGADPEESTDTPVLFWAVWHDDVEIARLLLSHGAKTDVKHKGRTPLEEALLGHARPDMVNLLNNAGSRRTVPADPDPG